MDKIFAITNAEGEVINRIIATQAYVEAVHPGHFTFIEDVPEPEPAAPVFSTLTRRQLRLGLLSVGITAADVDAQIVAIENPQDRAMSLIEWKDASAYERDHPLLVQVADALGLPPAQVDDLWVWSGQL